MGKEKRTPHRADGADNHGGTPYARPSARGGQGRTAHSGGTGLAGRGDLQASNNSLQGLAEDHGQRDRPEQTSIWRSLVSTPLRALKVVCADLSFCCSGMWPSIMLSIYEALYGSVMHECRVPTPYCLDPRMTRQEHSRRTVRRFPCSIAVCL